MAATFIHLVWWGRTNFHTPETSEWTILVRTDCHYEQENCSDDVDLSWQHIFGCHGGNSNSSADDDKQILKSVGVDDDEEQAISSRRRTSVKPNFPPEYYPGEPLQEERPQLTLQLEKPKKRRRRRVRRGRASASSGRVRNHHHER